MNKVYFVLTPNGEIIEDSVRHSFQSTRDSFVKAWSNPAIVMYMDAHTCWQVWECYSQAGFKIKELSITKESIK
jgi:hypothetical protein